MTIYGNITTVTAENLEAVREDIVPPDQRDEIKVGCQTWKFLYDHDQYGRMTVWPDELRGAITFNADSAWGDWDERIRTLRLDNSHAVYDEGGALVTLNDSDIPEPSPKQVETEPRP